MTYAPPHLRHDRVYDALLAWMFRQRIRPSTLGDFRDAIAMKRGQLAAGLLDAAAGRRDVFEVTFAPGRYLDPVRVAFDCGRVHIRLPVTGNAEGQIEIDQHLHSSAHFLAFCAERAEGAIDFHLADGASGPGLAFCSNRADNTLIPDYCFIAHRAYPWLSAHFEKHPIPWEARAPVAFWRGSSTGFPSRRLDGAPMTGMEGPTAGDWRSIRRIELCHLCARDARLFDVGLTDIVQIDDPQARTELQARGMIKHFSPPTDLQRNRYHIDIDGNVNAYSGLFFKLLSGSAVLKVDSPGGYRQWYYDRLRPFENFVPVRSDLSDLVEKLHWLRDNDREARRIGEAGRAFALSMSYDAEIARGRDAVVAALSLPKAA